MLNLTLPNPNPEADVSSRLTAIVAPSCPESTTDKLGNDQRGMPSLYRWVHASIDPDPNLTLSLNPLLV